MIAYITVHYNNPSYLERFIRACDRQTNKDFTLYVVENGSPDSARSKAHEVVKSIQTIPYVYIECAENGGFAAGCNAGIRRALDAGAQWIVLLNSDTEPNTDFHDMLVRDLPAKGGIVAIPLHEGTRTIYAGERTWFHYGTHPVYDRGDTTALPASWYAIGAGVAFSADVVRRVGLWDERYFLYFEDVDFNERAVAAGITRQSARHARLRHAGSATTKRTLSSAIMLRYHMRNALLLHALHAPFWIRIALPFWALFGIVRQLGKLSLGIGSRTESRALIRGALDFFTERFGPLNANDRNRL